MNINLTLIGQTIIFAVFVWFCMKFIWPPIVAAMTERKKKISDGLAAAEKGHKTKELALVEADDLLANTKKQAAEIINNANIRKNEIINEAKESAMSEAEVIKIKAKSDITSELNLAREHLRKEVSTLILSGVKQIVAREVKESDHQEILANLSVKL